ncbi:MAG: fibrillarin-like rRNA/tRNA 2'-O-methyltransferase [archaeon]
MKINNLIINDKGIFTIDLLTKEKRFFDPFHSKIAAAIRKGIAPLPINIDSKILYLGCAEGYTCSYLSDIVTTGIILGVDLSAHSMQRFYLLSKERDNLIPFLYDASKLDEVKDLIDIKFDLIIQDVSQKTQLEILKKNSNLFLKDKGYVLLSLKLSAISQKNQNQIIEDNLREFRTDFEIIDMKKLDPFEKKHLFILGRKK